MYKMYSFDKIPSTQDFAHELVEKNKASDKTVILANTQTNGYGQYKRKWTSRRGNLFITIILKIKRPDVKLAYTIAVATNETIKSFGVSSKIKWPNDIMINGAKSVGILTEFQKNFALIGIGVNLKYAPTINEYRTGRVGNIARDKFLIKLLEQIEHWQKQPFDTVRKKWLENSSQINDEIEYNNAPAEILGIANDGALIIKQNEKLINIYSVQNVS